MEKEKTMSKVATILIIISLVMLSFGQSMYVHTVGSSTPTGYPLGTIDSITFDLGVGAGVITGKATDTSGITGLSGVTAAVYSGSTLIASATTSSSPAGIYSISVPAGTYSVLFSKTGYISVRYYNIIVADGETVNLQAVMQIPASTSAGVASGIINNAMTGTGVSGLSMNFRAGVNTATGTIAATTTTTSGGAYSISSLAAGNYTAEVYGTGYTTKYFTVVVIGGVTRGNQNATITPIVAGGQYRIILTWGAAPSDVDSHLTGDPASGTVRFHTFYGATTGNGTSLDVDDRSSYGPETITISAPNTGLYRYSVHDFSNRLSTTSTGLSTSGAQVNVYYGSTLLKTYNVPNAAGTLWTVFTLQNGILTDVNTMTNQSDATLVSKLAAGSIPPTDGYLMKNLPRK